MRIVVEQVAIKINNIVVITLKRILAIWLENCAKKYSKKLIIETI